MQKVFDYSSPAFQTTFDSNTRVWELSVNGPANAPTEEREPGSPASNSSNASLSDDQVHGSVWTTIRQFIPLGIEHILTGYDHIAFLLALIVIGLSLKEVLKIITAFTVAHSITLLLAALQIVSLNSRFVESVIALSICYVAVENILQKESALSLAYNFRLRADPWIRVCKRSSGINSGKIKFAALGALL